MGRKKGADEIFCRSCGVAIKREAAICPECGTRNTGATTHSSAPRNQNQNRNQPQGRSGTPAGDGGSTPQARSAVGQQSAGPPQDKSPNPTESYNEPTPTRSLTDGALVETIAPYAAWASGVFLVLMGLAMLATDGSILRRFLSTIVFCAAGLFAMPPVREQLKPTLNAYDVTLSRAAIVAILVVALFTGALLAPP